MAVVIDLDLVCVVCLQNDSADLKSVFTDDDTIVSESNMGIAEKISFCSELNLRNLSIKTSNKICNHCLDDLNAAWRFRKNCETANSLFRSIQEEEDVVSLTNYELECPKGKLSTNLKLRREIPAMKSYLSTSRIDEQYEDNVNETDGFSIVEYIDEEDQKDFVQSTDYFDSVREGELEDVNDAFKDTDKQRALEKRCRIPSKSSFTPDDNDNSQTHVKEEILDDANDEENPILIGYQEESDNKSNELMSPMFSPESFPGHDRRDLYEKENSKNSIHGFPIKKKFNTKKITPSEIKPYSGVKLPSRKGKSLHSSMKICEICGNIYKYQHALSAHMRRHNNDRQFACELCDKAFVSNVELRRHMRVHTGHKPYPCSFCDRRFSDFGSRSKHERTHTGERPYRCTTCNKSFAYPHVLTVHLRTHTGEKKFQCTRCGRGFTKKAYLLAHLENHARCENISIIGELNDNGSAMARKSEVLTTHQQEITAIKTVALEECIFTTELMDDSEQNMSNQIQVIVEQDGIDNSVMELEEHLDEENDVEYILGVRS
ncbi:zinc finger protein 37 [Rhagoletis pomonella]|uniref:zinc finger protein 37 n=1 Tax=Rhagoletis pomonella TaxID=28610 RepID=UPI001786A010|nr:zinc finger protein 37 [Rhagoletis pomonella]